MPTDDLALDWRLRISATQNETGLDWYRGVSGAEGRKHGLSSERILSSRYIASHASARQGHTVRA